MRFKSTRSELRASAERAGDIRLDGRRVPGSGRRPDRRVALRGRLEKMGEDYLLRANLQGQMETTCARCSNRAGRPERAAGRHLRIDRSRQDGGRRGPDVIGFWATRSMSATRSATRSCWRCPSIHCAKILSRLCTVCGGNLNVTACACKTTSRRRAVRVVGKLKLSNSSRHIERFRPWPFRREDSPNHAPRSGARR